MSVAESDVELAAIEYLQDLGWQHLDGPTIAPDGPAPERTGFGSVLLEGRLTDALRRINGHLPASILDDVLAESTAGDLRMTKAKAELVSARSSLLINEVSYG